MSTAFGAPMISPSQDEIWLLSYFKMPKDKMEQERLIFCRVLTVFIIFFNFNVLAALCRMQDLPRPGNEPVPSAVQS